MGSTQQRHDDIVIQRRFGENTSTRAVKQVYAVTYPDHTDQGTERESYGEAEQIALTLAEEKGVSVWYEESSQRKTHARQKFSGLKLGVLTPRSMSL